METGLGSPSEVHTWAAGVETLIAGAQAAGMRDEDQQYRKADFCELRQDY